MYNQKLKIFTIGGSGLVGSRVNELLSEKYTINDFSTRSGIDITQANTLENISRDQEHDYIILYAAKSDVDSCEKDKNLGENGSAYKINVSGVQNVVNTAKSSGKKLIYISTDFIFDGASTPKDGLTEESPANPVNWYGQTKYLGEKIILNSDIPFLIIRISYPFRTSFEPKKDFARAMLNRLQNNLPVIAVADHTMTPTFIDDIAYALDMLISRNLKGIYHVTGSQSLSPYEAVQFIAQKFNLNKSLITPATQSEFFKNRAPRPFNLTMNNAKIRELGIKMRTFEEGLSLLL